MDDEWAERQAQNDYTATKLPCARLQMERRLHPISISVTRVVQVSHTSVNVHARFIGPARNLPIKAARMYTGRPFKNVQYWPISIAETQWEVSRARVSGWLNQFGGPWNSSTMANATSACPGLMTI